MKHEGPHGWMEDSTRAEISPVEPRIVGSGRTGVQLELLVQGCDLLLLITGGKAHVGAVAVLDGRNARGPAVVTELADHREGLLAGECAEILGEVWEGTVVAVAGIHQDRATRAEIDAIVANVRRGAHDLAAAIAKQKRDDDD